MNKVIDISSMINAEEPQLALFGKTYKVKNDHKTMLLFNELQRKFDEKTKNGEDVPDADEKIFKLLLGDTAGKEVTELLENTPNYIENTKVVMLNIVALATGEDYETLQRRFQNANR